MQAWQHVGTAMSSTANRTVAGLQFTLQYPRASLAHPIAYRSHYQAISHFNGSFSLDIESGSLFLVEIFRSVNDSSLAENTVRRNLNEVRQADRLASERLSVGAQ